MSTGDLPVKKGHSVILRIYDALGGKSKGVLTWGHVPVKGVKKVNALEDELEDLSDAMTELKELEHIYGDGEKTRGVKIELRAFEIATYKLILD